MPRVLVYEPIDPTGESLEWRWGPGPKYHGIRPPSTWGSAAALAVANGLWTYRVNFTQPTWIYAAQSISNRLTSYPAALVRRPFSQNAATFTVMPGGATLPPLAIPDAQPIGGLATPSPGATRSRAAWKPGESDSR